MPYTSISQLPKNIKEHLPKHAQEIYMEAFNNAWEQYKSSSKRREGSSHEETAHRVAWAAVKQKYEKNEEGKWIKK